MEEQQQRTGLHPLAWVGIGCGVLILIISAALVFGGIFVANKVGDVAKDFKDNPELAAARMVVKLNPEIEEVSFDEDAKTITLRDKKSGETVTASFKDLKDGKLFLTGEDGETVTFSTDKDSDGGSISVTTEEGSFEMGSGDKAADLPDWVPVPDGVDPTGHHTMKTGEGQSGGFSATSKESMDDVMKFYDKILKKRGFSVSTQTMSGDGGEMRMVSGVDKSNGRNVNAMITLDKGETALIISYSENNTN